MKNFLLRNTILFSNFSEEEMEDLLSSLHASTKGYKKNEYILHAGEHITYFGIVLSGRIVIENTDFLGHQIILGENRKGAIFGEIYAYLEKIPLMVDVRATEDTEVLFLDLKPVNDQTFEKKSWYIKLLRNLLTVSAKEHRLFQPKHSYQLKTRTRSNCILSFDTGNPSRQQSIFHSFQPTGNGGLFESGSQCAFERTWKNGERKTNFFSKKSIYVE